MSHASDGDLHDNPQTRGMAEFVSGMAYESVPAEVLQRLKLLMLDSVGCALYGSDLPWTRTGTGF